MKLSVLAVMVVGTLTAVEQAFVKGIDLSSVMGVGATNWSRLDRISGSQYSHRGISFDKSVAIFEKQHQVAGFRAPPNASQRAMEAIEASTMIDFAAAAPV